MCFLPLILSPHSFPICLSLCSSPQIPRWSDFRNLRGIFLRVSFSFVVKVRQADKIQRGRVCQWTHMTTVICCLSSSWGTPKALRSLCMCVCIFMQGFEVVLLNASFGCIGKLFFNLAWQAQGLGFASAYLWVSIDV